MCTVQQARTGHLGTRSTVHALHTRRNKVLTRTVLHLHTSKYHIYRCSFTVRGHTIATRESAMGSHVKPRVEFDAHGSFIGRCWAAAQGTSLRAQRPAARHPSLMWPHPQFCFLRRRCCIAPRSPLRHSHRLAAIASHSVARCCPFQQCAIAASPSWKAAILNRSLLMLPAPSCAALPPPAPAPASPDAPPAVPASAALLS